MSQREHAHAVAPPTLAAAKRKRDVDADVDADATTEPRFCKIRLPGSERVQLALIDEDLARLAKAMQAASADHQIVRAMAKLLRLDDTHNADKNSSPCERRSHHSAFLRHELSLDMWSDVALDVRLVLRLWQLTVHPRCPAEEALPKRTSPSYCNGVRTLVGSYRKMNETQAVALRRMQWHDSRTTRRSPHLPITVATTAPAPNPRPSGSPSLAARRDAAATKAQNGAPRVDDKIECGNDDGSDGDGSDGDGVDDAESKADARLVQLARARGTPGNRNERAMRNARVEEARELLARNEAMWAPGTQQVRELSAAWREDFADARLAVPLPVLPTYPACL